MEEQDVSRKPSLLPPAVTALREQNGGGLFPLERSNSMDFREEREDLKAAAEQSLNVVVDLGLDGIIRWVSTTWKDVVGTPAESIKWKPIADIILSEKEAFAEAVQSMKKDDSRSQFIRFRVAMGPDSVLKENMSEKDAGEGEDIPQQVEGNEIEQQVLNLEGQGIMVYDRKSGGESHVRHQCLSYEHANASRPCGCCVHPHHRKKSPLTYLMS